VQYEYLATDQALADFCRSHANATTIAFDTEFVSEDTYGSELCLIQVAVGGELAIIDPFEIEDVSPFWHLLAQPGHETVVHAGREEFRFCVAAIQQRPAGWFDVQVAAAFVGLEYPASYSNLISRLLGESLSKGETRTDWRRRPLSRRQLDYAIQDVEFLAPARDELTRRMDQLGRRSWYDDELAHWQEEIEATLGRPSWRRLSGLSGMSGRQLAIVRELFEWRDNEAREKNSPPRRLLRDDLLIELARRQTADIQQIRAVRGLEFRHLQRHLPEISQTIQRALDLEDSVLPRLNRSKGRSSPQLAMLGQFLSCALSSICRSMELSPAIVGTVEDVRELVAHRLGLPEAPESPPALSTGWRADVIGKVIDDLLAGKLSIRIVEPISEHPLAFEASKP
jgi:ribonuclease D